MARDSSGLLVPNNDESALADQMNAIARGDVFPEHVVPDDVVQRTAAAYAVEKHVEQTRRIFQDVRSWKDAAASR